MIIVEGCDNTGKTTLINNLCKDLPLHRAPKSPGPATEEELWDYMLKYLNRPISYTKATIMDRFPIPSEEVYGPVLRNGSSLSPWRRAKAEKMLRSHKVALIYCDRPTEEILKTFGEREQLEGVEERIDIIRRRYEDVIQSLLSVGALYAFYRYDFGVDSYEDLKNFIRKYLGGF